MNPNQVSCSVRIISETSDSRDTRRRIELIDQGGSFIAQFFVDLKQKEQFDQALGAAAELVKQRIISGLAGAK